MKRLLEGKRVLVVGLGISGRAAARLAVALGGKVVGTDLAPEVAGARELAEAGVELVLGGHRPRDFEQADVVVLSPGVDERTDLVALARARGAEVIGELELAARVLEVPAVAITGTNGKSTVTTLVGEMLRAGGMEVFVGGNLGTALSEFVLGPQEAQWAVLEVSSFQAIHSPGFVPRVCAVLNITPDHLDRHGTMDAYAIAKMSLVARQGPECVAVLCMDDPEVAARAHLAGGQVWGYGAQGPRVPGGWWEGEEMVIDVPGRKIALGLTNPALATPVGRLNVLAAALVAAACGAGQEAIADGIGRFRPLRHRLELVAEAGGVCWYDDSKATNPAAAAAAVEAVGGNVVLLLGGRDKGGDFRWLWERIKGRVRGVICFGEAGERIAAQLGPQAKAQVVGGLEEAVSLAASLARPGTNVVLAPGCASFDAYPSYAARGEHFARLVKELIRG